MKFARVLPTLPVLAILVVTYLLSQIWYTRLDLTQNRRYTLNDASIAMLDALEDPLQIKMYFSEDLPPRFRPVYALIQSLVEEYEARGKGKVKVTYIDPGANIDLVEEAHKMGIFETKANVTEKSRIEMSYIWFGMALSYQDRREVFPSVTAIDNLEYTISSAIGKLMRPQTPKVRLVGPTYAAASGFVFDIDYNINPLYQELKKLFDVDQIRVHPHTALDLTGLDLIFVWGLHDFTEEQRYAVDQYLLSGRPAVVLASGVRIDPNTLEAQKVSQNEADAFLAHYGFAVQRNLVADQLSTKIKYTETQPPVLKDYPLFPALYQDKAGLDRQIEPTASLNSLILPWPSSLSVVRHLKVRARVIARTSNQSWLLTEDFNIDPAHVPGPHSFDTYPVGLAIDGEFVSYYKEPPAFADPDKHLSHSQAPVTLNVWGSEHLLTQSQNASIPTWAVLSANHLTHGLALAGIDRSEDVFRPVRDTSYAEKLRIKWLSVTVAPALILLLAVGRTLLRRRKSVAAYLTPES